MSVPIAMSEYIFAVCIRSADQAPEKYSRPITKSTGVVKNREIIAIYGMTKTSYFGIRTKSNIMKNTIGSERIAEEITRICHFFNSCLRFVCSPLFPADGNTSEALYPASSMVFLREAIFVLSGIYLMRAFSEAKFTFASITHTACPSDFSMSPEQLVQCIQEISKVAMERLLPP